MSFTEEVKHELTRRETGDIEEKLAELSALTRMNGSIEIINKEIGFKIRLNYGDLARKIYKLFKNKLGFITEIIVRRHNHFSHYHIYDLVVPPQPGINDFLEKMGFLDENGKIIFAISKKIMENREFKKAYLRGIFLGGGSINPPSSEYHLEFRTEYEKYSEDILDLLASFELEGHKIEHKGKYVIYLKNFSDIVKVLNLIGAHRSLLKMENAQILKGLKNDINRKVNCETANLEKTVEAAMAQLKNIGLIEKNRGLNNLPPGLREIADLRKKNPYASLKELGKLLNPPLSKSGVNHRLRRIEKIAQEIRGEN